MKIGAIKSYRRRSRRSTAVPRRSLAAERAKLKLPFKPDHVTEEQVRLAVASLAAYENS